MQKDKGMIHKLLALIFLFWGIICWGILGIIMKVGYTNRFLEDCMAQANLAALVVDPYHYGSTGELVFENVDQVKLLFEAALNEGLGSEEKRKNLGLKQIELIEFRVFEVTAQEIREVIFDRKGSCKIVYHTKEAEMKAPDGTTIENSAVYAQIAVSAEFLFGIEVTATKEHCADIVSEGMKRE